MSTIRYAHVCAAASALAAVVMAVFATAPGGDDGAAPARFTTSRSSPVVLPLPEEDDAFFFVVFGDRTGGPPEGVEVLAEAVRETNLIEPDLVMTVGDLVEGYNTREPWMAQMREYTGIMKGLVCPWFPVPGNHDIYWRGPGRTVGQHEADFEAHFGPLWYAFDHKGCRFIVLYSDEGDPETGVKDFNKPAAQRMSDAQFDWLAGALEEARDARHVFLFLHHPRWLGGNYGDDWERVHRLLASAGNVSAVFAGHIHHMRHDGVRDGIEYVALATVGGVQGFQAPSAGYLHQYHVVTVRPERIAMAAVPVGQLMDIRAITGRVSEDALRLSRTPLQYGEPVAIASDGSAEGTVRVTFANPVSRPVEVNVELDSRDSRWSVRPDHRHEVVPAGESVELEFHVRRLAAALDGTFRELSCVRRLDYLAEGARFPLPDRREPVPLRVEIAAPPVPPAEIALDVRSGGDVLRIPSERIELPDGPLTLECRFLARSFSSRTGLVAKTENSEYGFFVNDGVPSFNVFLGDRYAEVKAEGVRLAPGSWHHIAGVYDGREVRLYVDGRLAGRVERSGPRRTNGLSLLVGADIDGAGSAVSPFDGMIDEVRLSRTARYAGDRVTPPSRHEPDAATVLLLHMDGATGQWTHDASGRAAHARAQRAPNLVPAGGS